jgi:hypothetical protein
MYATVVPLRYASRGPHSVKTVLLESLPRLAARRWLAIGKNDKSHEEYMREANKQMERYHEAREAFKAGKLKSKNPRQGSRDSTAAQFTVAGVFLVVFFATPFLGRKIAQDDEFRERWIPSWYDFTVKKPDNAWTRDELHEQMLEVQRNIRERAIAGDFTPEKLEEMQRSLEGMNYPHREGMDRSKVPKVWDSIHPGAEDDDDTLNEA